MPALYLTGTLLAWGDNPPDCQKPRTFREAALGYLTLMDILHMPTPSHPYQDPKLPVEQRVTDLMQRMTREERVAQLVQIFVLPHNREEVKGLIRKHGLGSRIMA